MVSNWLAIVLVANQMCIELDAFQITIGSTRWQTYICQHYRD